MPAGYKLYQTQGFPYWERWFGCCPLAENLLIPNTPHPPNRDPPVDSTNKMFISSHHRFIPSPLNNSFRVITQLTQVMLTSILITWLIEIDIALLTVLFCNCPLLKDVTFNTKCLLVWCDWPVISCLVRAIFGINHPCDFWKNALGQSVPIYQNYLNVQYTQNVFSFEKGSNIQKQSSWDSHHPIKKSPRCKIFYSHYPLALFGKPWNPT